MERVLNWGAIGYVAGWVVAVVCTNAHVSEVNSFFIGLAITEVAALIGG